MLELLYFGVPAVALIVEDDQTPNVIAVSRFGAVINGGVVNDKGWLDRVARGLQELSDDPARRARMSKIGKSLVDGRGASRIANTIRKDLGIYEII